MLPRGGEAGMHRGSVAAAQREPVPQQSGDAFETTRRDQLTQFDAPHDQPAAFAIHMRERGFRGDDAIQTRFRVHETPLWLAFEQEIINIDKIVNLDSSDQCRSCRI
jgi:hypothetical protein